MCVWGRGGEGGIKRHGVCIYWLWCGASRGVHHWGRAPVRQPACSLTETACACCRARLLQVRGQAAEASEKLALIEQKLAQVAAMQ